MSKQKPTIIPLQWTDVQDPCPECRYHHVSAETPFGRFLITWKGWKKYDPPSVDISPWESWVGCYNTVEEAKEACEVAWERSVINCISQDVES